VGKFSDDGYGGTTLDRPGLEGVRELVETGNVDLVLAQDQDRFSREPAHQFYLEKDFEKYGCKLRAMNDGDDTPEGDLLRGIRAQVSKYERVQITERTRRGKLRRAREGKVVPAGSPPMGWSYDGDTYVPNDKLLLARQIIERAAQGTRCIVYVSISSILESVPWVIRGCQRVASTGTSTPSGARSKMTCTGHIPPMRYHH
jgi:DNA invertase Pin-like site-specific DNA recombinase